MKTGILRAGLLHHLNDLAGQRADVGSAVTADFRFVAHAAKRHANELSPVAFAIDMPSEVLPTPGGPTKQRIEPFGILDEPADGKKFEDAFLDLLETVVIALRAPAAQTAGRGFPCSSSSTAPRAANQDSSARPWIRPTSAASSQAASAPRSPSRRRPWSCPRLRSSF